MTTVRTSRLPWITRSFCWIVWRLSGRRWWFTTAEYRQRQPFLLDCIVSPPRSECEKLRRRLREMQAIEGLRGFHLDIVEGAQPEAVAREVNRILDALESGDMTKFEELPEDWGC